MHIDRHGLICTAPGIYEYAAWIAREEYLDEERPTSPALAVRVCTRFTDVPVLAYDPATGAALARAYTRSARYDEEGQKLVFPIPEFKDLPVGTPVCFRRPPALDHEMLTGQLDNAISAAIAFTLVERGFGGRVLLTTEEEIGRSWMHTRDHLNRLDIRTDRLIVLDTSPYPVADAIDAGVVVLRSRDKHASYNPKFVSQLESICRDMSLPYQFKDKWIEDTNRERAAAGEPALSIGSTELGRLIDATGGEITGATVQLPTFGYHSNNETTSVLAIDHVLAMLGRLTKTPIA